jgi:hypothetical protein
LDLLNLDLIGGYDVVRVAKKGRAGKVMASPSLIVLRRMQAGLRCLARGLSWESQVKSGETTHKIQDTHVDYFWIGSVHWIIFGSV